MKLRISVLLCIALTIALPCISYAQTSTFSIGGSYTHNGDLPQSIKGVPGFLKSGTDIGGVDVGLSSKLFGPLGLAFDGNFSHSAEQNQFLFAGGPELSKRFTNQRLFAHALIGGAYETQKLKGFALTSLADSSFAYDLGGGYEKFVSKHVGLRTGLDYFYTEAFKSSDHNVRATLGLAIR
jgi:hypothetical protein